MLYLECKIPFRLRPFQYVDFRTSSKEGLQELLSTLGGDRAAAQTAAVTPVVTTTPAAALAERDRKAAEEKKRRGIRNPQQWVSKNKALSVQTLCAHSAFFTSLAYGGWLWSEILYDQQVINSFAV